MDSQRFFKVMSLFQEACVLEGAARTAYLDQACDGDGALRSELMAMLEADAARGAPLDANGGGMHLLAAHMAEEQLQSGTAAGSASLAAPPSNASGLFAGQYRIIRQIGEGGMGAVYEAEQSRPRRIVALKLIRGGSHSTGLLQRFEHEAHILGRLQHPGIAQIYEAGTDESGQAYIAMEFVAGLPMTEFANTHELSVPDRLALMMKVCDAVQHAHQRGVIHRDLKPGNILVVDEGVDRRIDAGLSKNVESGLVFQTAGGSSATTSLRKSSVSLGQPKVLDFGVARSFGDDQQITTMHTVSGQLIGTLAYMSPEQVSGEPEDVDIRSDVYALGVILFQLLSGQMPYDLKAKSLPEAARLIRDVEAPTLSSFSAHYRGDIETIVVKALQKDRERRYQSAAELAEDIRRHLAGEPIGAKRDSALYVLRRQLRRYRVLVGAGALVAAMTVGFAAWLSVLYQRQGQLLNDVESQRDKAIAASKLAGDRLKSANELRELEAGAREAAVRSAGRAESVKRFLQQMLSHADPSLARGPELTLRELLDESASRMNAGAFTDSPDIEAEMRLTIGEAYSRIGRYDEAMRHFNRALEINQNLTPGDSAYTAESKSLLAGLYGEIGNLEEADRQSLDAVEMFRRLEDHSWIYGAALNTRGIILLKRADYAGAEAVFRECMEVWRVLHGDRHVEVAGMMQNLGAVYMALGRRADAESMLEQSVALFAELLGSEHPYVALGLNNLGAMAFARQDFDRAEELLTESQRLRRIYFGEDNLVTIESLVNIGILRQVRGDMKHAESSFREAIEAQRRLLGPSNPRLADTLSKLGQLLQEEDRLDEAEECYREALDIRRGTEGPGHPNTASDLSGLASILSARGDYETAEQMHREALAIRRKTLPPGHRDISSTLGMLAALMIMQDRFEEAEPLARETMAIRRETIPNHYLYANSVSRLAAVLTGLGRLEEAEPLALEGWELIQSMRHVPLAYQQDAVITVIRVYETAGRAEEAKHWQARLDALTSSAGSESAGDGTDAP
ncbi:MAG: serine/threonine protein kinase [Phycisphaerae bacterium]|nr:serine/threonine protein kinase [Phycisphaerae bacterium]